MTIETLPPAAEPVEPPGPTAAQLERLAARKRFNRLYVYLPAGIVVLVSLGVVLALLWLTVVGDWFAVDTNQEYFRVLTSGIADALTVLFIAPMLLLCAIPIAIPIGLAIYRRQQKKVAPVGAPQLPLLWRVENRLVSFQRTLNEKVLPRVAQPIASAYAAAAYVRTFFQQLRKIISREINRYVKR